VVSSSKNAKKVLYSVALENQFDAVVDGTVTKKSKPAPDCFLMAAELLGLSPSECVVFEDAPIGVDAARKGGFLTVGVGLHRELCAADFRTEGFEGMAPNFVHELNFIHTESE
jgi:beta-phosphoglucomutase